MPSSARPPGMDSINAVKSNTIINLIATIFNLSSSPVQFVITTHSPYILAALNNLIQAGNTFQQLDNTDRDQLREIVPDEQLLKTENIRVYSLYNGTASSIVSDETGLISTNLLDEVSDELATQFDNILSIE
jgi:hypothetical protein